MGTETIVIAQHILVVFAIMFTAGALAGRLAGSLKIPDVVLYLLVGIIIGPPVLNLIDVPAASVLNQLLLTLGAAFLLFQGGTEVSLKVISKVWLTLLLLATLAVMVMVFLVGLTAHLALGIALLPALLLAAVIASTDPATLVPIFLSVRIRDKVVQTVLSESAFNDATAAIFTFAILGALTTGEVSFSSSIGNFFLMAGGGILTGLFYGSIAYFLVSSRGRHLFGDYVSVVTMATVIAAYMTSEHFGFSGFMAVFVAGLLYGNLGQYGWQLTTEHTTKLHSFMDMASLFLRMSIFILLGTHVEFSVLGHYLLPGCIIVVVFMFIARPVAVLLCTLPDRQAKWQKNEILFMFWTRETGVIPAALSGMLVGRGVVHADIIAAVTFMAILATLVIQAGSTRWLAGKLGLLETTDK